MYTKLKKGADLVTKDSLEEMVLQERGLDELEKQSIYTWVNLESE